MCHEARPLEDEDHHQRQDEGDDQVEQAEDRKGGENVSRILNKWIRGKIISRHAGYYCIETREKIEEFASL